MNLETCAAVFLALAHTESVHAINLNLTAADVERALVIARSTDAERARFHAPYITALKNPVVERFEIVSEFRRIVLLAEDHILKGDRMFAYRVRLAQEAVAPWKGRVSVIAQLRFHPLNTYVDIPKIEITLDGPRGDRALIGVLKQPLLALASRVPGEHVPILGAVAEGVFDAALIGQSRRSVTVKLDGKEVATTALDFAAVE